MGGKNKQRTKGNVRVSLLTYRVEARLVATDASLKFICGAKATCDSVCFITTTIVFLTHLITFVLQPSSSGRAAEVLAREGGVIPGFVGFDTSLSLELSYVPAVHGAEEIDNLVDADFRLVLRKLSKRDVVTRLKVRLTPSHKDFVYMYKVYVLMLCSLYQAVQDFGALCQERDAAEVKGVLPYWPRIYCKIAVVSCSATTPSKTLSSIQLPYPVRTIWC